MTGPASRASTLVESFQQALTRLKEALARPRDEFMRDACIQRFEFTYEMFWKSLKAFSEDAGLDAASPRDSLCAAAPIRHPHGRRSSPTEEAPLRDSLISLSAPAGPLPLPPGSLGAYWTIAQLALMVGN